MELRLPENVTPPDPRTFVPHAGYSAVGDLLWVYLDNEPGYARQLTPEITVLVGFKTGRVVGVKVAGVAAKVKPNEGGTEG